MTDSSDDVAKTGRAYRKVGRRSTRASAKLDPVEIEELIAFSRQSALVQMERLQALLDGATLAAEQVQDKRIELLEQGPEVTATEVLLDFALTFALETPLVGKALAGITKVLLLPRVRRHLYAKEYLLKTVALRAGRGASAGTGRLTVPVELEAKRLADEMYRLNRIATALSETGGDAGAYPYVVAVAKAQNQTAHKDARPAPELVPTDSTGVMILDLAQAYASKQRLCIETEQILLELALRTGRASRESVVAACSWDPLSVDDRAVTLAEAKDQAKRWFELVIWTLLLWEHAVQKKEGLTGDHCGSPKMIFNVVGAIPHFQHVPISLERYWLLRFINPNTGRPFFYDPPRVISPERIAPGPETNLSNYMRKIADAAQRNQVSLLLREPLVAKE